MTNRFKGLDLIDRVPEEPWTKVHKIVWEAVIKTIQKKKRCTKAKCLVWGSLQIAEKRKDAKDKREKPALSEAALQIAEKRKEAKDKREK